jgi:hypothetical protein
MSSILLFGNYISGDTIWSGIHKHNHRKQSGPEQGECHAAKKSVTIYPRVSSWLDLQSDQRVTSRLRVHAVGNSLANSFDASKRRAIANIF